MVNGGKLRGTIMANISVVCLCKLEYILQEKIIATLFYLRRKLSLGHSSP